MVASPAVIRLAVFGNPVLKSLSPRIHSAFADQLGLNVDYRAIEATHETFAAQVGELAQAGALGCNITLPFKHAAYALAADQSETARRAGAANTLVFGSPWSADNTDGRGLLWDLQQQGIDSLAGKHIGILGAGGAAAGVLAALMMAKPRQVTIANRTVAKASELAESHEDLGTVQACNLSGLATCEPLDLLINATSLGHAGENPAINPDCLMPGALLYDLNYGQAATPLKAWCQRSGIRYSDGLGMLVGQAAESFTLWTGQSPRPASVLGQLRSDLGL